VFDSTSIHFSYQDERHFSNKFALF